jgi:DMSO reductase anchor subunit
MGAIIFAALFGLAVGVSVVEFAVLHHKPFSFRMALVSGIAAVLFVVLVATVVGYFLTRVRINDHYEANSVFMAVVVIGPATVGAVVGAIGGALIARCIAADRS